MKEQINEEELRQPWNGQIVRWKKCESKGLRQSEYNAFDWVESIF